MLVPTTKRVKRILDFDIENMPLTYYAPDYPTARITAIASAWTDDPKGSMHVCLLGEETDDEMLVHFLERFHEADMVTGHYIRKHDLPIINGALVEAGFYRGLSQKLVSDTKEDLVRWSAIPKNQEYLEAVLGTKQQKKAMTQADWREANKFTPEGLQKTRKRVETDVRGNIQMRNELIERGLLKAPRLWRP